MDDVKIIDGRAVYPRGVGKTRATVPCTICGLPTTSVVAAHHECVMQRNAERNAEIICREEDERILKTMTDNLAGEL